MNKESNDPLDLFYRDEIENIGAKAGFGVPEAAPMLAATAPGVIQTDDAHQIALIAFHSKSGGNPHFVTIREGTEVSWVTCSCKAMLNISTRPKGCWAMVAARKVVGIPAID